MPAVSVIMNCLNGERFVREAIDSVYAQTYGDWEIVFWDNASTDRTAAIATSYDSKLRYFKGERTTTLGEARNYALAQATGEFVAFLDSDDIWFPTKLEKQIPLFAKSHRTGLVFSDAIIFSEQGVNYRHYSGRIPPTGMVFRELLADYFLSLETVVVRTSALHSLDHWFDPRFNIIEETDLFTRLGHDWQFAYVDEPLGKWRIHADNWTFKRRDLQPTETEQFVEKLLTLYPHLEASYGAELRSLLAYSAYRRALLAWQVGDKPLMRATLSAQFRVLPRAWSFYALSFFPYAIYPPMERARRWMRSDRSLR